MKILVMLCLAFFLTGCGENTGEEGGSSNTGNNTVENSSANGGSSTGDESIGGTGNGTSSDSKEEAQKNAFVIEAQMVANAAQTAYLTRLLNGDSASSCITIASLYNDGYLMETDLTGSVLVSEDGGMQIWVSNGKYKLEGANPDVVTTSDLRSGSSASSTCGN